MKKTMILVILMALYPVWAYAETRYITDQIEINLRSGPGAEYRIIRMLESGQKIEVLENKDNWSRVQVPDGPEGWVFSRYLQRSPAARKNLQVLTARLEPIEAENESLRAENERLLIMNQEIADQLEKTKKKLQEAVSAYEQLQESSAEFLKIKEEHENLKARLEEKNSRIEALESKISEQFLSSAIKWFLAGAGVLLIGILLGNRAKKKRPGLR